MTLHLSDDEINHVAWSQLLDGAESFAEDWIDEEGEFTEEEADRIFDRMFEILDELRATVRLLLDG